jgi:WD40 repeat protein
VLLGIGPDLRRVAAHPDGAVLAAAATATALATGGDDGRVVLTGRDGTSTDVAAEKGWIDALAAREDGTLAWASGRQVFARTPKGDLRSFTAPSTARGLAFAPKGYRIAIAHYNGATLWFPNTAAAPEVLEWKGSHHLVTVSPDARFLVTAMQENALHGWRLADAKNMRMSGYPAKTRSFSWSMNGEWLATSGADACIVWPFKDKDGPMAKSPRECGVRRAKVSQVAFHPKALVVAIGYEDGCLLLCRLSDGSELLVRAEPPGQGGAISALAWDGDGRRLLFGAADGAAGLLEMPAG